MDHILSEKQLSTLKNPINESFSKYAIRTCRTVARLIGLWPMNSQMSIIEKIIKLTLNVACLFILSFILISSVLYAIFVAKDLKQQAQLAGPVIYLIICISKYVLLMCSGKKIEHFIKLAQDDWQEVEDNEQEEVMIKNAKYGYYLTVVSAVFMYSAGFWHNFVRPLSAEKILTHKNISIKPYPGKNITFYVTNLKKKFTHYNQFKSISYFQQERI